jgi:hypothetical protein
MKTTQMWCVMTWEAAKQCMSEEGLIPLNHCSAAGWLLEQYESPCLAFVFCPPDEWFNTVRGYLLQMIQEENRYALTR